MTVEPRLTVMRGDTVSSNGPASINWALSRQSYALFNPPGHARLPQPPRRAARPRSSGSIWLTLNARNSSPIRDTGWNRRTFTDSVHRQGNVSPVSTTTHDVFKRFRDNFKSYNNIGHMWHWYCPSTTIYDYTVVNPWIESPVMKLKH